MCACSLCVVLLEGARDGKGLSSIYASAYSPGVVALMASEVHGLACCGLVVETDAHFLQCVFSQVVVWYGIHCPGEVAGIVRVSYYVYVAVRHYVR